MPRRSTKNHIQKRRRRWYALLDVPKDVQGSIGRARFLQSLKTESETEAQRRAAPLVAKWRAQIDRARADNAGEGEAWETEARSWREALLAAKDGEERDLILDLLRDHVEGRVMTAKGGTPTADSVEELPGYSDGVEFFQVATGQRVRVLEHLEEYIAASTTLAKDKTKDMARADVGKLAMEFEYVQDVTRKAVQRWTTRLMSAEGEDRAPRTVNRYLSACRGYWRYLHNIEVIPEDAPDPFASLEVSRSVNGRLKKTALGDARRAFDPADVVKLHRTAEQDGDQELADLILLAMYTGCRIEELCSLTLDHVHADRLSITDAKTAAGWREVPLHPRLKKRVTELADGSTDGYLLSGLPVAKYDKRSPAISKRFGRFKKRLGFDKRHVFHSIRKTVATLFERANVPHNLAAEIMGHEKAGTMTYTLYSGGFTGEDRAAAMEKLEYPTVSA